jgi:hypothetical protein
VYGCILNLVSKGQEVVVEPQTMYGRGTQLRGVQLSFVPANARHHLECEPGEVHRTENFTTQKAERKTHTAVPLSQPMPPDPLHPSKLANVLRSSLASVTRIEELRPL